MFPPKSLGLAIAACVCVAAARQSLSNPHDGCEFTIYRSRYDLCPLFLDRGQDRVFKVYAEPTPNTQLFYEISFGDPLITQSGKEAEPQCPPGTWVCLRERFANSEYPESHFTNATPIAARLAVIPHTTTSTRLEVDAHHDVYNGELEIALYESVWGNRPQTAHFRFICDQRAKEASLPTLVGITAGNHNFEWMTPHACAKEPRRFSAFEQDEDTPPAGDDNQTEGDGSQDLVDPLPVHHTVRNLMIVFAVASSAIFGLKYLIRHPPPNVKRWVRVTARKLPFRVGEGILVQWAEEAMFINDEEDVMVNYEEEYDFDEQIPLKPSPTRLYARFMDYGSAGR